MIFRRFSLVIVRKMAMIIVTLSLLSYLLSISGYYATSLLLLLLLAVQCISTFRFVEKTNTELNRFLNAARYADFSQRFEFKGLGLGFDELGRTFSDILQKIQINGENQARELNHIKSMIEHVPVPLVSIHSEGKVTLCNNSARRLFGANTVHSSTDLKKFGHDFAQHLTAIQAGERRLVTFVVDGMEQQLTVCASQILVGGKQEKFISMQDIQGELDTVQLQAWQDLVWVLTHEIMNSITPVASLAKTAADLLADVETKMHNGADISEDMQDISAAVQTVARRSDGLMTFVTRYRQLSHLPTPAKQKIKLNTLFQQVSALATQHWSDKGIELVVSITPGELTLNIDIDMIEHMLINLLKNAEQAVEKTLTPMITLKAYLNKRGHIIIDIADNGAGVTNEIAQKIFVPFFTTKINGSGVGLALTRQVMTAHGGTVKLEQSNQGGALFRLTF